MTENKRYYRDFNGDYGTIIRDRKTDEEVFEFGLSDSKDLCDLLNSQEEIITEQKEYLTRMGQGNHLKIIMEQKERIKELEQENKRLKQSKYVYGIHGGSNDRK